MQTAVSAFTKSVQESCVSQRQDDVQSIEENCSVTVSNLQFLLDQHYAALRKDDVKQNHNFVQSHRQEALDSLMNRLGAAVSCLSDTMEEVSSHADLKNQPDPEEVLAYGHRLRFTTFHKMGTLSMAPNPQLWQMGQSTFHLLGQQHAAKQQVAVQHQVRVKEDAVRETASGLAYNQGFMHMDGSAVAEPVPRKEEELETVQEEPVAVQAPASNIPRSGIDHRAFLFEEDGSEEESDDEDEDNEWA